MTTNKPKKVEKESGDGALVTGSVVSGGMIGAGIAVFAKTLDPPWDTMVLTLAPTFTSAWAVLIATGAKIMKRQFYSRKWHIDRQKFIEWLEEVIPASEKGLEDAKDPNIGDLFEQKILRLEKLRALAMTAVPYERPWETSSVGSSSIEPEFRNGK